MVKPVIGDLHELQCRLMIRCEACLYQVAFLPSEAVDRFGWRTRVADLRPKLKCSRCKATARNGKVVMGLVAEDIRARNEREDREALHPEGVKDRSPGGRRRLHSRPKPDRASVTCSAYVGNRRDAPGKLCFHSRGRGRRMDYRLYFLNPGGHIKRRVDLECEDDDHAVKAAAEHRDGCAMELWRRDRRIKGFPAGIEP